MVVDAEEYHGDEYYGALLADLLNSSSMYTALAQHINISALIDYYEYDLSEHGSLGTDIAVLVIFGLAFLSGIVGNGLVIFVVCKHGPMKTVTNIFFVNLAIADLLFLCTCVPFTAITYVLPEWPLGAALCKVVNYMNVVSMVAAVLTLTALGIDRYHAVVKPVVSRNYRTVRRALILMAIIWLLDVVMVIPTAVISQLATFWEHGYLRQYCVLYFHSETNRQLYTMLLFLLFYVIPLIIIGGCYFKMVKYLWTSVQPSSLCINSAYSHKSRGRIAKMVLVVVATFAFCWLPIHCIHLRNDFGFADYSYNNYVMGIIAHALSYFNSAINPVIYSFMSRNFRQCCRAVFCCKKVAPGAVFIVVEQEPKRSGVNNANLNLSKGATPIACSSTKTSVPLKVNKVDMCVTSFPLPPVKEEGANPDMIAVAVV